jgi:predicted transcriptional regulator YdeE
MFTIGDFARLGRVSVRMLRHYDAVGLLEPAAVDRFTGYRYYRADHLRRLNRIVALKELGFTLQPSGPGVAYYEDLEDGEGVRVHASVQVAVGPDPRYAFEVVDLPGIEVAATIIHRGSMDDVDSTWQHLAGWIEEHGYRGQGYPREYYVDYCPENPEDSVTELQWPVRKA